MRRRDQVEAASSEQCENERARRERSNTSRSRRRRGGTGRGRRRRAHRRTGTLQRLCVRDWGGRVVRPNTKVVLPIVERVVAWRKYENGVACLLHVLHSAFARSLMCLLSGV